MIGCRDWVYKIVKQGTRSWSETELKEYLESIEIFYSGSTISRRCRELVEDGLLMSSARMGKNFNEYYTNGGSMTVQKQNEQNKSEVVERLMIGENIMKVTFKSLPFDLTIPVNPVTAYVITNGMSVKKTLSKKYPNCNVVIMSMVDASCPTDGKIPVIRGTK